ncbi:MAG: CvpA family protein [Pseudomonadota bacterium]|nr:CvpA family protein [Pseudomonadota bacterium]MDQ3229595.1 CvpA family protein [Pseudomonadota bacterium]
MSPTDWMLLAIIALSALLGVMRGLVGVVVSIVAWLLAGLAAFHYGAESAQWLSAGAAPGWRHLFAGYGLSFIAVLVVVGLVGWMLRRMIHSAGLSGLDRTLGFMFGLVRGGVIACVLVLALGFTSMPREPAWRQSLIVPLLIPGAAWLRDWLPPWAADRVQLG